jgi:hypothetical protein
MTMIIIVSRSTDAEGRKAYNTRGQLFDAHLDGMLIVRRSTQPLLDAARALLADGFDPTAPLAMRHADRDYDAFRTTVGTAAKTTVWNDGVGKPVFASWKARESAVGAPYVRQTDGGLPMAGSDEILIQGAPAG